MPDRGGNGTFATLSVQLGRLEGEVKHLVSDLQSGRQRIHDLTNATATIAAKLDTLVETGVPQRERMINKLEEIDAKVNTIQALQQRVDDHSDIIDDHGSHIDRLNHFKTRQLTITGVIGGTAGLVVTIIGMTIKHLIGGRGP